MIIRSLLTTTVITALAFSSAYAASNEAPTGNYVFKDIEGSGSELNIKQVGTGDSTIFIAHGENNVATVTQIVSIPGTSSGSASGNALGSASGSSNSSAAPGTGKTINSVYLSYGATPGTASSAPAFKNKANVTQQGAYNSVAFDYAGSSSNNNLAVQQVGLSNVATGRVSGNGNNLNAYQNGNNNSAYFVQGGNLVLDPSNGSYVPVTASGDIATIKQSGDGNSANIYESAVGKLTYSNTSVSQQGNGNVAEASLSSGFWNVVSMNQLGNGNRAKVDITGSANNVAISQHGDLNTAGVVQNGIYDIAAITQTGSNDTAVITQNGSYDTGKIVETGNVSHQVSITQNGSHMNQTINIKGK